MVTAPGAAEPGNGDPRRPSLDGVVDAFRINWVWMPPWGPEKITDDGRDMMRALGFSI